MITKGKGWGMGRRGGRVDRREGVDGRTSHTIQAGAHDSTGICFCPYPHIQVSPRFTPAPSLPSIPSSVFRPIPLERQRSLALLHAEPDRLGATATSESPSVSSARGLVPAVITQRLSHSTSHNHPLRADGSSGKAGKRSRSTDLLRSAEPSPVQSLPRLRGWLEGWSLRSSLRCQSRC